MTVLPEDEMGTASKSWSERPSWPFSRAISGPSHTPPRVDDGFFCLSELPLVGVLLLPPFVALACVVKVRGLVVVEGGGDDEGGVGNEPAEVPASDEVDGEVDSAGSGPACPGLNPC